MLNINQQQYNLNIEFEKNAHIQLNEYYKSLGWQIINRQGKIEYDLQIKIKNEEVKNIEEKIIRNTYDKYISIEIVQDLLTLNAGWIHYSKADILIWAMFEKEKLNKVLIYDYPLLKRWWIKKAIFYDIKSLRLEPRGNGLTLNQLIPFEDIKECVFKEPLILQCPKCGGKGKPIGNEMAECKVCFYQFYFPE